MNSRNSENSGDKNQKVTQRPSRVFGVGVVCLSFHPDLALKYPLSLMFTVEYLFFVKILSVPPSRMTLEEIEGQTSPGVMVVLFPLAVTYTMLTCCLFSIF